MGSFCEGARMCARVLAGRFFASKKVIAGSVRACRYAGFRLRRICHLSQLAF